MRRLTPLAFLVILLLILPIGIGAWVRDRFITLFAPANRAVIRTEVSIGNWFRGVQQISSLREQQSTLQTRVLQLQQELGSQEDIRRENELLRKELGVEGVSKTIPKALAHIVLQNSDPLERTVTIDAGSEQGVRVGQPAVSEGVLVGRVTQVQNSTATVRFITSRSSLVQGWLASNREKGLVVGQGNTLFLTDITQGISVQPGDLVETSGLGDSLPSGIPIGQINEITSKPSDTSQEFTVTPLKDVSSLDTVFILLTEPPQ